MGELVFLAGPDAEEAFTPDEYVTRKQLAARLKVSTSQIDRWAKRETDPLPSVDWGLRLRRFRVADVDRWLKNEEAA